MEIDYTAKEGDRILRSYKGDFPVDDTLPDGYSLYASVEYDCEGHDVIVKIVDNFDTFQGVTFKTGTDFSCGVCGKPFKVKMVEKKSVGTVFLHHEDFVEPIGEVIINS